jgi:oxygen-independent coproporphyrinogen III oxidase
MIRDFFNDENAARVYVEKNIQGSETAIPNPQPPTTHPLFAGFYIHIPFCLTKCPYCGFFSVVQPGSVDAFIPALLEELKLVATQNPPLPGGERDGVRAGSWTFDTVYFGGGTPSLLMPEHLEIMLKQTNRYFNLTNQPEITFEINPGDAALGYFQRLFDLGINRLNLGVQSFDENTLKFLGRRHNVGQVRMAIEHARKAGFKNIGLDLIYGIPGQSMESWLETLNSAILFSPEHLSCYELTIEENTPFALEVKKGVFSLPGEEGQRDFFIRTSEWLEAKGYIHYEVSNFAREEEHLSRHNQKYWDHTPYLGLGPSAHSFSGARRWWNYHSVEKYIAAIANGNLPIKSFEDLTLEQRMLEEIYFGMRTRKGIDLKRFQTAFQVNLETEKGKTLSLLKEEGLITIQNGVLSPTLRGLAVADRLALL